MASCSLLWLLHGTDCAVARVKLSWRGLQLLEEMRDTVPKALAWHKPLSHWGEAELACSSSWRRCGTRCLRLSHGTSRLVTGVKLSWRAAAPGGDAGHGAQGSRMAQAA